MRFHTIMIAALILLLLLAVVPAVIKVRSVATVTDTVMKTERVNYSNTDSRYLIFGKKEIYEDQDTMWFWKFNSSDIYGKLQVGKTYKLKVYGWRVPFLSWYRNIVTAEQL